MKINEVVVNEDTVLREDIAAHNDSGISNEDIHTVVTTPDSDFVGKYDSAAALMEHLDSNVWHQQQ